LKDRLKKNSSQSSDEGDDELISAQREAQVKQLTQTVQSLQNQIEQKKEKIEKLHVQQSEHASKILALEQELAKRPTDEAFQNLKERCRVLESISFGSIDNNSDSLSTQSVEQLLSQKNKHLEDQITRTKRAAAEKEQQLKQLDGELTVLRKKTSEQQQLIEKLEEDLYHNNNNGSTAIAVAPTLSFDASSPASPTTPASSKSDTMLQIVSEQRNRFKKRTNELEEANQILQQKLDRQTSELNILQKDNVSLYEKIRYLQSYNSGSANNTSTYIPPSTYDTSTTATLRNTGYNRSSSNGDLEDPIGDKYKKLYEQKLDPFKQFHRDEKDQQYQKLSAAEKITFSMTRLMMSHKYSRLFVFFYFLALHLLVFLVSYKLAHIPVCRRQN
jgi:homeobox protein cut-like